MNVPLRFYLSPGVVLALLSLMACHSPSGENTTTAAVPQNDTAASDFATGEPDIAPEDTMQYADFFVVVADTGMDYYALRKTMYLLKDSLRQAIDTMGRYFNEKKNLIALPDDDEDEMYAGDYFPRRFPSEDLSLEYLASFKTQAAEKTIALVTGIYEQAKQADSALAVLKTVAPRSFRLESTIFVGCMH